MQIKRDGHIKIYANKRLSYGYSIKAAKPNESYTPPRLRTEVKMDGSRLLNDVSGHVNEESKTFF